MNLSQIEDCAISIANGIYGDLRTKEKVRDMILDLVAFNCHRYTTEKNFKMEIDSYIANRKRR